MAAAAFLGDKIETADFSHSAAVCAEGDQERLVKGV